MGKKDKKPEENDAGSLGYWSDPQVSPEHNINWAQSEHQSATWIEFTEQPADYRYRYLKEKYHGHIVGVSSPPTKKKDLCKFPKLKLNNYSGSAIVRVWLISTQIDRPRAHFHKLARKPPKGELTIEPHDFKVSEETNYEVTLDYLHIIHAVSNDEHDINVYRKKKAHIESDQFDPPRTIPSSIREEKEEIKQIDKNQSFFYVQVFDENTHTRICESIISSKIKNLHNAETAALKIVNCSRTFGTCRGNDEVFIFVEKISKDVQVRFFRLDSNEKRIWQALAIYGPQHVHHQLGIVFRTPKFEKDIENDTQVFFELHRKNDGAVSEPFPFTYKPHKEYNCNDIARKRPHSPEIMSSEDEYLPSVVTSYNSKRIKDESMSPDSTTVNQQLVTIEPVNLVTPYYPPSDNLSSDDEVAKLILNSFTSNELDVLNQTPLNFTQNYDSLEWLTGTNDLLDSKNSLFEIIGFDGVTSSEDFPTEENINCDGVTSSEDHPAKGDIACDGVTSSEDFLTEDSDNDLLHEKVVCDDGPSSSNKSQGKIGRKSSHSKKLDLISTIYEKKPIEEFKELLKKTVDINAVDYEGNSALHYAVRTSVEYLEPILKMNDVDRKLKNLWGDDPLLDATRNGSIEIVKLLLKKDFEPNVQNSRTGETPLHLAVSNEDCLMAELLLKHGADPLLENHSGKSAYEYSMDCSIELRRILHFLMQKSMFQKRKADYSNKASCSPLEYDLATKLNELTVSAP